MFQSNHKTYFVLGLFLGIAELVRFYYMEYPFYHSYHFDDSYNIDLLTIALLFILSTIPVLIIGTIELYFFKKYPENKMRFHKLHRNGTIIPIFLTFIIPLVTPYINIPRRYYAFEHYNKGIITELFEVLPNLLNIIITISALIFLLVQIIPIFHFYLCKNKTIGR